MSLETVFAALPKTIRGLPAKLGVNYDGTTLVYVNGSNVILRSVQKPIKSEIYSNHTCQTSVAKFSANGEFVSSGDERGNIQIWGGKMGHEHNIKYEYQMPLAPVNDVHWCPENSRIVAGGVGRERFGHVFNISTGTTLGEIMGMSKPVQAVDFSPCRPFRVALASEDGSMCFFDGPPFVFSKRYEGSGKSLNCIQYSFDGELLVTGGGDGKVMVFNGKTGEVVSGEVGNHSNRSVMGVAWKPKSKSHIVSVGTDGEVKIWSVDDKSCTSTRSFDIKTNIRNQLLGCVWNCDGTVITVSLSGHLNYFTLDDQFSLHHEKRILGHQKPISVLCGSSLFSTEDCFILISADQDGSMICWQHLSGDQAGQDVETWEMPIDGGHTNQIKSISAAKRWVVSCGLDDMLVFLQPQEGKYISCASLTSQPVACVTTDSGITVVACMNSLVEYEGTSKKAEHNLSYGVTCLDISPGQDEIAVGGKDNKIHIYKLGCLSDEWRSHDLKFEVSKLAYSSDGQYLAAADNRPLISCFKRQDWTDVSAGFWCYHAAQVTCLRWSPGKEQKQILASGSVDSHLIVYDPLAPSNVRMTRNAHHRSPVTSVCWKNSRTLFTAGHDCCIKQWKI